jgi:hypothetical protein
MIKKIANVRYTKPAKIKDFVVFVPIRGRT